MGDDLVKKPQKKKKIRRGLALTLYLWFMLLSVGPVSIVGINEYREAKDAIVADHYQQLSGLNLMLTQRINDYFDAVITNLFIKATVAERFIADMVENYHAEGLSPNEYVMASENYYSLTKRYSPEFIDFLRFYDYSDVLLGDAEGNILYTVNGYEDLGSNLFKGELADTLFAMAVRSSMEEQQPRYSDVGPYPPIGSEKVSFFVLPLTDSSQQTMGFIAVQIHANNIQTIFEQEHYLGLGLHSYLVGDDSGIRFGTDYSATSQLKMSEDNPLIKLWLDHINPETGEYVEDEEHLDHGFELEHDEHEQHDDADELFSGDMPTEEEEEFHVASQTGAKHIRNYINHSGELVLGTFLPITVGGKSMAIISEVSQNIAFASINEFRTRMVYLVSIVIFLVMFLAFIVSRRLVKPIRMINDWVNRVASGDYVEGAVLAGSNEISELSQSFNEMTRQLRTVKTENERRSWMQDGVAGLNESVQGEQDSYELCRSIVGYLANYLGMQTGAMYVLNDDKILQLMGTYAWRERNQSVNQFNLGEGLVGQAALEKQIIELNDLPEDYLGIESGLGKTKAAHIIIVPLVYEEELKGVIEFAYLHPLTELQKLFLEHSLENVAIAINSSQSRARITQLLKKTTKQSEAMKEHQEELRAVNDELEKRALSLEESEEEMRAQSDELQKSNVELEEKSEQLTQQKEEIERKNRDIELSSKQIEEKAKELELASKYKSEFLANMSHELRTPLNSLLLLAQMLAANDEGNLTPDQVESAEVIYNGGNELLELINDILDLSKVEAGKMSVNLEDISVSDVSGSLRSTFKPLAESRGLEFDVTIEAGTTEFILTDSQRLLQIMKNFLSNAFKFTEEGGVYVRIFGYIRNERHGQGSYIGFAVRDTGIGIPKDKQAAIFESFQQADGSTSRKYGGTGLGLAISREMSSLLGGFIEIESEGGEGTTFTVFLPDNAVCSLSSEKVLADSFNTAVSSGESGTVSREKKAHPKPAKETPKYELMSPRSLLLIEDDPHFIDILKQVAQKNSYEFAFAETGSKGLDIAIQAKPAAIILDLGLPDMNGREVLKQLKQHSETRDIPVHIISGEDHDSALASGTLGFLVKPVTVEQLDSVFSTLGESIAEDVTQVLILDLDEQARETAGNVLSEKGIDVSYALSPDEAEAMLVQSHCQCLVMDLDLGDRDGIDFLANMKNRLGENMPSVVIQTARVLSNEEHLALQEYTSVMVVKGDMSDERLTDEVNLFLHSVEKSSPEVAKVAQTEAAAAAGDRDLSGHKILLVDDDLRNTFALSKALQGVGLEVVIADNGKNALDKLEEETGIELVLMDIMMPVMDGYEATRIIRQTEHLKEMPVISLTAKAMSDDKAKCLEAGANDYMTKPLNMDKLVEMLKVWLFK